MSSLSRPPLEDIQGDRIHCDQRPDHTKDPDIDLIKSSPISWPTTARITRTLFMWMLRQ